MIKLHCYTSKLKYVFRLEENASRIVGQNSLTPQGNNNNDNNDDDGDGDGDDDDDNNNKVRVRLYFIH